MSQVQNQIQRYKGRWWGAVKHSPYAPRDLFLAEKTGTPRHKFGRVVKCSPTTSFFFFSFFFFLKKKKILLAALCSMWDHSSLTRDQTHAVCIGGMES